MHIANSSLFRADLYAVALNYRTENMSIEFVNSPSQWGTERGIKISGTPIACALLDHETDQWTVLIQNEISEAEAKSVIDKLEIFGGVGTEVDSIRKPKDFLIHLLLHEIAHLKHKWGQDMEQDCDRWAFEQAAKIAA